MRQICPCLNIYHLTVGVAQRLNIQGFGILLNRVFCFLQIEGVHKCGGNTVIDECVRQEVVGSAVDILGGYDMISRFCHCLERIGNSRRAGGNSQRRNATLQCCNSLLKDILCGIGKTSVNIPGILQGKPGFCVITVAEHKGRCLIDRNGTGIRYRIRLFLADMKGKCLKM